jgi:hypothetical protein
MFNYIIQDLENLLKNKSCFSLESRLKDLIKKYKELNNIRDKNQLFEHSDINKTRGLIKK